MIGDAGYKRLVLGDTQLTTHQRETKIFDRECTCRETISSKRVGFTGVHSCVIELCFVSIHSQARPGSKIVKALCYTVKRVAAPIKKDHNVVCEHQVGDLKF